jgi:hypothetical protein
MAGWYTLLIALSLLTKAALGQHTIRGLQQSECSPNWEIIQEDYFKNQELRWTKPACYTYDIQKVVFSENHEEPHVLSEGKVTVDNLQVVSTTDLSGGHIPSMEELFSELALHCFQGCPYRGALVCEISYGQAYGNIEQLTINENPTVPENGIVSAMLRTNQLHHQVRKNDVHFSNHSHYFIVSQTWKVANFALCA